MARQKLTSEVRRATDLNNSLSSQLDTSKLDEDKKQTDRRELLIQQLVTQSTWRGGGGGRGLEERWMMKPVLEVEEFRF